MTRLLIALLLAVPAAAQAPLTLHDAVERGLALHPAVHASRAAADAARAGVGQARAGWWPVLALDAGATRFGDSMVVAPLHGFDPTNPPLFDETLWQASLNVSWSVLDPARGSRIRRARAEARAAGALDASAAQGAVAELAAAYLEVRAARDQVAAHDARLAALARERERAGLFVREGRAARVVALRAEAALAAARAERLTAVGRRDVAERSFERALDLPAGALADRTLAPARLVVVEPPGREAAIARALAAHPDLAVLEGRVAAAEAARGQAQAAWLPALRLLGRVVQYGSGGGAEATEWQGGVAVSYPLFTGGARSAVTASAGARVAQADAELANARRRIGDAVDRALAGLTAAAGQVAALDLAVAQAEEVVRIEQLALREGAGVQTDYLTAEAELLRIRAARGDAHAAWLGARIELARLTGDLTVAWLAGHVESAP